MFLNGRQTYWVDASKDDQRWVVIHDEGFYPATVELMLKLGWDLEDG